MPRAGIRDGEWRWSCGLTEHRIDSGDDIMQNRARRRWLGTIILAILLAAGGLAWAWMWPSDDLLKRGWVAYAKGDWVAAARLARGRLKMADSNPTALRLLARATAHLGRDGAAVALYERLGKESMAAEDFYLLGVAMARAGDAEGSLKVLEQARRTDPLHARTLYVLTRAYSAGGQLEKALETCTLLASCAEWEAHAEALLGTMLLERNNPAGAITHWQRALESPVVEQGGIPTPIVPRKDLARALLQTGQPALARRHLQLVLAAGPDPEASWLSSRAYLQEGLRSEAVAAWEKAGSYRDENPLVTEPASFVGSAACGKCHPSTFHAQQASRHARTFFPVSDLGKLALPPPSFPDPAEPAVRHTLRWTSNGRLEQQTEVAGQILRAVAEYALGSGHRGLTFVGHDEGGQARRFRLSHYGPGSEAGWDITFSHSRQPSEAAQYLGQALTEDSLRRCFLCHVTEPRAVQDDVGPLASDRGIGCEKCHGPGGNHELAVKAGFPDLAIASAGIASGSRVVRLCAQCHTPDDRPVRLEDPTSVRFQGATLTWSRCFTQSDDALDCVTCHDPHRDAATSAAHYEAECLSCHGGGTRSGGSPGQPGQPGPTNPSRATPCPVNPATDCIACHMPKVSNVVPHSSFTDHFIRVHRD
jgi:tetratricopeptide (TPR) repeat protein